MPQRMSYPGPEMHQLSGGEYGLWKPPNWKGGVVVSYAPGLLEGFGAARPLAQKLVQRNIAVAALRHSMWRNPFRAGVTREQNISDLVDDLDSTLGLHEHIVLGHSLGGCDGIASYGRIAAMHTVRRFVAAAAPGRDSEGMLKNFASNAPKLIGEMLSSITHPLIQRDMTSDAMYQLVANTQLVMAEAILAIRANTNADFAEVNEAGLATTELFFMDDGVIPLPNQEKIAEIQESGGEVIFLPGTHMATATNPDMMADYIESIAA